MARPATLEVTLIGLLLAGCTGSFGQAGVSPPSTGDGVQTVSDAADALDTHRSSGSESAKSAIGVTDALCSFVRDISDAERTFGGSTPASKAIHSKPTAGFEKILQRSVAGGVGVKALQTLTQLVTAGNKRVISGSEIVMQPTFGSVTDFCQSSAGYGSSGIPSLDVTFGWQSGAFFGGARATDGHGFATWSANATGEIGEAAIGALSIRQSAGGSSCPMNAPAFTLEGSGARNAFSIPIMLTFHRGTLSNLSVANAAFSNGERLDVTAATNFQGIEVNGLVRNGRIRVATFRTNAGGDGALSITSTGAQYIIADWIVVGT